MAAKKPKTNPITDPSKFVKKLGTAAYKVATDPSKIFSKTKPSAKNSYLKTGLPKPSAKKPVSPRRIQGR